MNNTIDGAITAQARLSLLASEGMSAENFGTDVEHLTRALDPGHHEELRKLILVNPLKNRRLSVFLYENLGEPAPKGIAPAGNGHASNGAKVRRAKLATSVTTEPVHIEDHPLSLADEIAAAKEASQQRLKGDGAGEQAKNGETTLDGTADGASMDGPDGGDGGDAGGPLADLVARTAADPGAPFKPEVLARIVALKNEDRAAFQTLRAQLKKAGCLMSALDEAIAEETGDVGGRGPTQADTLVELAQAAKLFHVADGTGFADVTINGHRETWPIRAKGFRQWLARQYFEETGGAANSDALQSALNVIEAQAHFDAPERIVDVRVGGLDGRLYLDLGDEAWRAVEIDATGWRVIDEPPVRFRRTSGTKALPVPASGGSIDDLRPFLNTESDDDFVLAVSWALACLRNTGPYPVIALAGEQGAAKTTFSGILRDLLDPGVAPQRALPREDRDLFIAANNRHVLAFDNVSGLPAWISDTLCRLATGGGFAVRQLWTDQDETLFDATRPVILNGIEDVVTRADLADRAIFLTLEQIPEETRKTERDLWAAFETNRPGILGALLDAVSTGLAMLPQTKLARLPRMADFAIWATACETGLGWAAGTFRRAYHGNLAKAVESVIGSRQMTIHTLISGSLSRDPETKTSKAGRSYVAASNRSWARERLSARFFPCTEAEPDPALSSRCQTGFILASRAPFSLANGTR